MNKRYLFLTAWVAYSESSGEENTKINNSDDLYPQFQQGNEEVFAVEIWAPNEEIATMYGRAAAWDENFTGYDSVSHVMECPENDYIPNINKSVIFSL